PELFGFFTYELRIGHWSKPSTGSEGSQQEVSPRSRWCTAQGRFGPPLRVAGVQHPPPELVCAARRAADGAVEASAPLAVGQLAGLERTTLWMALYAQAFQLDGAPAAQGSEVKQMRNVLLATAHAAPLILSPAESYGVATFAGDDVKKRLTRLGFASGAP